MTTPTRCLNGCQSRPDDDGNRHPVLTETPSRLCRACEDRMLGWLEKIPEHYGLLPRFLEPGSVDRNPEAATTKNPHPPIPVRLEVLDLLDERRGFKWHATELAEDRRGTIGILSSHANRVRAEKNMTPPAEPTVTGECTMLRRHLLWICEQDWVTDVYEDLHNLHRELSDAVGDYRPKPVGRCQVVTEDGECNGPLLPVRYSIGVRCPRCGAQWTEHDLTRLGLVIG